MEKNGTLLKQANKNQCFKPREHVLNNILNYSKNIEVVSTKIGNFIVINN
ncbi:MAG: hypothetical protein RBS29_06675 [Bacteroidales bacterium]|jgi:hypothetical protein|nr:hypothetical protein [Bacteroidales bacterium]